jgi:four helix bundle protein
MNDYIPLKNLEVYKLSRELSRIGWEIYEKLDKKEQFAIGGQFLESTDSVGANIAEAYGRYHYLDRIKFLYNARGSFSESYEHWLDLLKERELVNEALYKEYQKIAEEFSPKFQNYINSLYRSRNRKV